MPMVRKTRGQKLGPSIIPETLNLIGLFPRTFPAPRYLLIFLLMGLPFARSGVAHTIIEKESDSQISPQA